MNRLLVSMGKVLMLAFLLVIPRLKASSQEVMKLNGRSVRLLSTQEDNRNARLSEAPEFRKRKLWILRTSEPLTSQRQKELRLQGVSQSYPLGNGCMLISLPVRFSISHFKGLGFDSFAPYQAELKTDPDLILTGIPADSVLEIQVLPGPSFEEEEIRSNWNPDWGILLEVWSGNMSKFRVDCTPAQLKSLAECGWTYQIEPADPPIIPLNQTNSENGRANTLHSTGFGWAQGLTGKNIRIAVGDGGMVETHADLESHQENLVTTRVTSFADHQDHVTGTIAGAGLLRADRKGMAPEAKVYNLQTSGVIASAPTLYEEREVRLTNNSYGVNLNCSRAGNYGATSAFIDNQLVQYPDLLHVVAAGNQGSVTCSGFPVGYNNIAEGYPAAKNVLTVGAVLFRDEIAWFSSKGPVRDGRLKPEIVVDGNDVWSTVPFDGYGIKSGTSMSTPAVTGVLALLSERYRQLHGGSHPESALLKGLVTNSAEDIGLPGPDFATGFGRLNARKARRILEKNQYQSGTISSHGLKEISIVVPAGAKAGKIMLSWTDPASPINPTRALIHNLDLEVENGNGFRFQPWVTDPTPSRVTQAAIRGKDSLNNMEQVMLDVTPGESLRIRVRSGLLSTLFQKYWLVFDWVEPELVLTAPSGSAFHPHGNPLAFRWDISGIQMSQLFLESSTDSAQWTETATISNPSGLFFSLTPTGTGIRKIWYRLKGITSQGNWFSNATPVVISPKLTPSTQTCEQSVLVQWTAISGASRYEIRQLDRSAGKWTSLGFTTGLSFRINRLINGIRYGFSVVPWAGNQPGISSDGFFATPQPGICPWNPDLGIARVVNPGNGRLFTQSAPSGNLQLELRNFGNQNTSMVPATLWLRKPDGSNQTLPLALSINAGQNQLFNLTETLNLSEPGNFPLAFGLSLTGDINAGNDSISTSFKVLSNPPVSLPWQNNLETAPSFRIKSSTTGLPGLDAFDFQSESGAQVGSSFPGIPEEMGTRAMVLDKEKIDGKIGVGDLILTLNLSNYPYPDQLVLDFDLLSFGSQDPENGLWVRASDQGTWVSVKRFAQENLTPGEIRSFRAIPLLSFLGNQPLTSSFQLRFSQKGNRPRDTKPGSGFAVDNLVLSNPGNDVVVESLLGPAEDCYQPQDIRKVKIRVRNTASVSAENVRVGYSTPETGPVTEIIQSLLPGESRDYEFHNSLPSQLFGKLNFKIWAAGDQDTYPTNDTLRHQSAFLYPVVNSYPYYEGFESNPGHWNAYGQKSSWEWGTPSSNLTYIDTAANGVKIWTTNLNGSYNPSETSYLQSPCFHVEDLQGDYQFSFNSIFQTEEDYDHAWLEVSEDGVHWWKLGNPNSGTNWYTHNFGSWNGTRKPWEVASHRIPAESIGNKQRLRFRFAFQSDLSLVGEGIGVDDVHLESFYEIVRDSSFSQVGILDETEEWVSFGDLPDKVALVENTGELGAVTIQMKVNKGAVRQENTRPYLDRNYLIIPETQPVTPVKVRLFVTDEEVKKLQAADAGLRSFQQLGIFKYDGPNQDLNLENNAYNSPEHAVFISPSQVLKVPTSGGYFLEFTVEGFSEFYIATQSLSGPETPLPVDLLNFTARSQGSSDEVLLEWNTASEHNLDRFELAVSCDGKNFETFSSVRARGSSSQRTQYTQTHPNALCNGENLMYRLRSYDVGAREYDKELKTVIRNPKAGKRPIQVVNPVEDRIRVLGLSGSGSAIRILDHWGRTVLESEVVSTGFETETRNLATGLYRLEIQDAGTRQTFPLLIR